MSVDELKHVIALLLEDAKRLQSIEPNAGTEARIWLAKEALLEDSKSGFLDGDDVIQRHGVTMDRNGVSLAINENQSCERGLQVCHCACR